MKHRGTFYFGNCDGDDALHKALKANGYKLYRRGIAWCWLAEPNETFVETHPFGKAHLQPLPQCPSGVPSEFRRVGGVSIDTAGNIMGWHSEADRRFAHACGE